MMARQLIMNRTALLLLAASGLVFAQTQSSGGWRRVGDRPAMSPPAASQPAPAPGTPGQDPEPVDRSDAYGQPVQQQSAPPIEADREMPPPQQQAPPPAVRNDRPSYGLPSEIMVNPG